MERVTILESKIQAVLGLAILKGVHDMTESDVALYLLARALPDHPESKDVVEKFNTWLATGVKQETFAEFFMPEFRIKRDVA